jgi:hypothetical protein
MNGYRQITKGRRGLGSLGSCTNVPGNPGALNCDGTAYNVQGGQLVNAQTGQIPMVNPAAAPTKAKGNDAVTVTATPASQPSWFEKQTLLPGVSNALISGGAGLLLVMMLLRHR